MSLGNPSTVYVVHCVDTEGPLYESTAATFERLEQIADIHVKPSRENLARIANGTLDLGGKEKIARALVDPQLLHYNETWDKVDAMLERILSPAYRRRFSDSTGEGWRFNWFIVDHVGYLDNPRRRDMGYHNIFDHYAEILSSSSENSRDEVHFHFHPMSTYHEAHTCGTSLFRSTHMWDILSRRVIDRHWFPSCYRAGFHTERPDTHWFLEQWIPFDFSNQAIKASELDAQQADMVNGRFGDWRRAPADWSPYHPSHDDYQVPGNCNRAIFRCLNIGTRLRLMSQGDIDLAFCRANDGEPTILAFTDHDFRNIGNDVESVHGMILASAARYPRVKWIHSGAKEAAQQVLDIRRDTSFQLNISLAPQPGGAVLMRVKSSEEIFGPQPYLAVKTFDKQYFTDNFDVQIPRREWTYVFDQQTIVPASIDKVGVAANSRSGSTAISVVDDFRAIGHSFDGHAADKLK